MKTFKDGGPAFPVSWEHGSVYPLPGMALRDYFAAAAMPQILAGYRSEGLPLIAQEAFDGLAGENEDHSRGRLACVAEEAYELADAMLAERAKIKEDQS
jgi:hypothetical protein